VNRRDFLLGLGGAAAAALAACRPEAGETQASSPEPSPVSPATSPSPAGALAPTPSCPGDEQPTLAQTEGPYFKPNTPERVSLIEEDVDGTKLVIAGQVMFTDCRPVNRALLDFWQADSGGEYDNRGYQLRGHQFTDASGKYRLETVVPGRYPGRTRHIHVKVQAPGDPVLTTQLYFPAEAQNRRDGIFDERLVMDVRDVGGGKEASFDFVLES
jgi:protocatechuate 3,4-dioxygenase beta subunit